MSDLVENIVDGFAGKETEFSKQVGLYFGSFNPVHIGHLIIANHIVEETRLDEIWFVVSPHNPHKKKKNLLADVHRYAMVEIAVEDNLKLKANRIEFELPKPSYTTYTLQALKEKHPTYDFTLIMGEDNLRTLHKWKNYEHIVDNYNIIVYPRVQTIQEEQSDFSDANNGLVARANIELTNAPVMKISSSFIRNKVRDGKSVRYLLPEKVHQYLDEMNFYK